MKRSVLIFAACLCGAVFYARGDGFIVVERPFLIPPGHFPFSPLEVSSHHVDVKIYGQVAVTSIDQEFYNPNDQRLEGIYMEASLSRNSKGGEFDTRKIVMRTAQLRAERAKLLGYENHAAYQLEDQTAKTVPTVNKLLADLAAPAVANARREAADMVQDPSGIIE